VSRVRENRMHGSMGGGRKPAPVGVSRAEPGASRLPDQTQAAPGACRLVANDTVEPVVRSSSSSSSLSPGTNLNSADPTR
jgi:hypothetical protein